MADKETKGVDLPWSLDDPYLTQIKKPNSFVFFDEYSDPRYVAKYARGEELRNELGFYSSPNYTHLDKMGLTKEYGQKTSGIPKFYGVLNEPLPAVKYFDEPCEGFLMARCEGLNMRDFLSVAPTMTPSGGKNMDALSLNETMLVRLLTIIRCLHESRVVHGDVACRNVVVNLSNKPTTSVSLVDFGSSRVFDMDGKDDEIFNQKAKEDAKNFGGIAMGMFYEDLLVEFYEGVGRDLQDGKKSLDDAFKLIMIRWHELTAK